MKIAIISDIHDNSVNLEKVLKYCNENQVEEIICLGDVTNDNTINQLAHQFSGKIYLVIGNVDFFDEEYAQTFSHLKYFGQQAELNIAGKNIAFTHQPNQAKLLLQKNKYDYIFFGHTHQPWEETKGKTTLLNPGTVAGTHSKATFAIWETSLDMFQLILIDNL